MSGNVDFWPNNFDQMALQKEGPVQQARSNAAAQVRQQDPTSTTPVADENNGISSIISPQNTASDVMDTNMYTSNLEFYGSASSVAFLRHVETLSNGQPIGPLARPTEPSLASRLHNTEFQPSLLQSIPVAPREVDVSSDRCYFRVARRFLDAYFSNIHYIQPIFEEEVFLARCEDLWFSRPGKQPLSFVALYYATLSLGSLVNTIDSTEISGADRFTWSRRLFNDAVVIMTRLGTATSIEMVQCFYMMGKICQHELNPHVAYLYSGQAARTALAIGINRSPIVSDATDPRVSRTASNTWWAVYCLDIQTSFALGRPDSLGPDQYHTQYLPTATLQDSTSSPHILQIVPCMVGLSRLMRKVALDLYTRPHELDQKLQHAKALDIESDLWLAHVPSHLRSDLQSNSDFCLKPNRSTGYIKKQSVVLRLRYLNLRMVIHAVFINDAEATTQEKADFKRDCQSRCIQYAEEAIDLMYSTFGADNYFQTWWYNATYTLFAVSVLLAVVFRQLVSNQQALDSVFSHIDRAILVLQAMDDCLVARNATAIIKRTLARAKKMHQPTLNTQKSLQMQATDLDDMLHPRVSLDGQTEPSNIENDGDFEWPAEFSFDDTQQALFWTEWAHELDILGT